MDEKQDIARAAGTKHAFYKEYDSWTLEAALDFPQCSETLHHVVVDTQRYCC